MQKKKNILKKIVKKDYNNELEKVLEKKQFGENAKSTLLSILYKIETAYKDYEMVKKDVETKEEYISKILNIIENDCDSIEIVKMTDTENKIPKNKTYIINENKKEIISYPIERKLLYAISKISKKERIINDNYFLVNDTISQLINIGNNINMVEPLRDFNGYSWTVISQEIESIDYNLIYQNIRILVGEKFLNKWLKNNEFIIDYYKLFNDKLENRYGKENKNKFIEIITKLSILLCIKFNEEKRKDLLKQKELVEKELDKIKNKEKFICNITKQKVEINEKIKYIDTVISNKKLLQEEYDKRNEKLPLERKIFSMRVLAKIMEQEKDEAFTELEKLNGIINPQNFIKYKKELEEKEKYLNLLDIKEIENEIEKLKIELQKIFLKMIKIEILKAESSQEIEKIIYQFRYYLLLPYDNNNRIQDIEKIKEQIKEISKLIVKKAVEYRVLVKVSKDEQTNYDILKSIFTVRIIKLEDAYLKITKEKEKYFVQIFDENIFEQKIEISKPEGLEIKLNKKMSFWERF